MTICGGTLVGRLGNNLNYCLACSSWNTSGPHLSQSTIRFSTTRRRWFIPFSNSSFLTESMCDVYFNFGDDEGEIDDWCFQQPFIVVGSLGSSLFPQMWPKIWENQAAKIFYLCCLWITVSEDGITIFSLGASLFTDDHCFFFCRSACLTRSQ